MHFFAKTNFQKLTVEKKTCSGANKHNYKPEHKQTLKWCLS